MELIRKRLNFSDILAREIGRRKTLLVVEKLAGTTPKSAILFLKAYGGARYRIFNLGDSSERYFERAEEICKIWDLDFGLFKEAVQYNKGINLSKTRLSALLNRKKADAIVYWGPALHCFETFEGVREEEYLRIFEEEKEKGGKNYAERHQRVLERHQAATHQDLALEELRAILTDDLKCLKKNGVIITNFQKDFDRIKDLMAELGLVPANYSFDWPADGIRKYEKVITVWKRKSSR